MRFSAKFNQENTKSCQAKDKRCLDGGKYIHSGRYCKSGGNQRGTVHGRPNNFSWISIYENDVASAKIANDGERQRERERERERELLRM